MKRKTRKLKICWLFVFIHLLCFVIVYLFCAFLLMEHPIWIKLHVLENSAWWQNYSGKYLDPCQATSAWRWNVLLVSYHFNDLLFISKEDTESMFFWMQGEQTAGNILALNSIAAFSACPVYHEFILLDSLGGHLCSHTSPLFSCCLTWPVAFGCWWIFECMVS